jgi:hypothetical protein
VHKPPIIPRYRYHLPGGPGQASLGSRGYALLIGFLVWLATFNTKITQMSDALFPSRGVWYVCYR